MPRREGQKNVSQKVVDAIMAVKIMNPDFGAKGILDEIHTNRKAYHINGDRLPGEGGVYQILRDNKNEIDTRRTKINYIPNELDSPWSVGSCLKYNISPAMVPVLIEFQQVEKEPSEILPSGIELTIRECRWIAFLYQGVNASEVLKNKWEPKQLKGHVSIMASMYAKREQIAEIMHQPIDTSDLDEFFSDPDTDFLKLWLKTFGPKQYEKDKKAVNFFQPVSRENLISISGMPELTQEQVDIFNEWLRNEYLSQVEPHKAYETKKELLARHPEKLQQIQPIIESWYKWIEMNEKDGDSNG